MKSRMEKYNNSNDLISKRSDRNESLYKTISELDLNSFNVNSNVAVIGENKDNLDIKEVQDLVKSKYEDTPRRRSISVELEESRDYEFLDEHKEYDINNILNKARSEKNADYQTDRLKRLRDTQYDILQNLDLEKIKVDSLEENVPHIETIQNTLDTADEKLMTLIKTITSKEYEKHEDDYNKRQTEVKLSSEPKELDPLDLLADLKGTDNTIITSAINIDSDDKTFDLKREAEEQLNKTFFTASNSLTPSDFDDINELKEDVKKSKLLIKILILLIFIAFAFGLIVLLNTILDLGWF